MQKINNFYINLYHFLWRSSPNRPQAASLLRFLDHTQLNTHTQTHTRQNPSTRVISPSQRPLPTHHTASTRQRTYNTTMQRVCLCTVAIEKQQCILCRCQVCENIKCCTTMLLFQFYVSGHNKTYVGLHVKCSTLHRNKRMFVCSWRKIWLNTS